MNDGPSNAASRFHHNVCAFLSERASPPSEESVRAGLTDDFTYEDRRRGVTLPDSDAESTPKLVLSNWEIGAGQPRFRSETVAVRGERCAAVAVRQDYGNGMLSEAIQVVGLDATLSRLQHQVDFDIDDVESAVAELDRMQRQIEITS